MDELKKKSETVKVAIRCRPVNSEEAKQNCKKCVSIDTNRGEVSIRKADGEEAPRNFFFDKVYDDTTHQEHIFNETALPIINSVIQGYNGTIFAYGQTGTGKTFTMQGKDGALQGIIPRSFEKIFQLIKNTHQTNFLIRVSFLEIYNEDVRDLLSKNQKQKLDIREDPETGFYVKDLSSYVVKAPEDMTKLLEVGKSQRVVGGHDMNAESSRSHSIFTIIVDNSTIDEDGQQKIGMGKLNLVDLAGSERQSKTGATGVRAIEATKINLSLTALGKVIAALVSDKETHIPYRDSKLTKLLSDSLGGNSKTIMIANIGPVDFNYDETVNTLRYANRAKNIKNTPKINEDPKDAMIRQYQDELNKLKAELAEQMKGVSNEGGVIKVVDEKIVKLENKEKLKEIENKLNKEKETLKQEALEEKKTLEDKLNIAEDEKLKILEKLKEKQIEQEQHNKNKEKILQKLKMIEEKFIIGEETEKKAKEQECLLDNTRKELENREAQKRILQEQIQRNEEGMLTMEQKYEDQKTEITEKKKIYDKLMQKLTEYEQEKEDISKDFEIQHSELYEYKREIEKEINYKDTLITHLIPLNHLQLIEQLMDYDEKLEEWFIPQMPINQLNQRNIEEDQDNSHKLAMGFNDYDELFSQNNQNMINNDIQLSMILEMNNPKNVYLSYDNDKKSKKSNKPITGKIR